MTGGTSVLTTSAAEFGLPTTAGRVYVVERTAKPLSSYTSVRLTGTANQGEKALSGTTSTLGMARTPNPMVNNSQLTYDSNWHATSGRGYGDYNDDTHHSTTVNAVAQYTFTGTGVAYISERNGDMGPVDVYLDGAFQATVDLKVSGARQVQQTVWQRSGLTQGTHTIRIVNRSTSVGWWTPCASHRRTSVDRGGSHPVGFHGPGRRAGRAHGTARPARREHARRCRGMPRIDWRPWWCVTETASVWVSRPREAAGSRAGRRRRRTRAPREGFPGPSEPRGPHLSGPCPPGEGSSSTRFSPFCF
ncbi:hypothetical protein [Actinacidiphila glaucinigra]|uniref:hypothetical protein n=1 Tax=Actinacidiphila glaucinigra TaxID=235986 RepID=UPI00382C2ED7